MELKSKVFKDRKVEDLSKEERTRVVKEAISKLEMDQNFPMRIDDFR